MGKIAGIDLGTTFSSIAVLNELGKPEIVPNRDGERITPSAVYLGPDTDRPLVGREAKNMRGEDPSRTFVQFKRRMGEPDEICPPDAHGGSPGVASFGGHDVTPVFLSSLVLRKLVDDASHHEQSEIDEVVISVPAYFRQTQREATVRAAKMAGLNVIHLVNEPTAAAIHYGTQNSLSGNVMVFDLGGGTFDVTILSLAGSEIEILTSQGNARLGGTDFDRALLAFAEEAYQTEFGSLPYDEHLSRGTLEGDLENLKVRLSKLPLQKLKVASSGGLLPLEISREVFDGLIEDKLQEMSLLVETALDELDMTPDQITATLLVGGSTRVPAVASLVEKIMGKPPIVAPNVDETVALGAAIQAGIKVGQANPEKLSVAAQRELERIEVTDIANASYGTLIMDSEVGAVVNDILIPKNKRLPCEEKRTYFTVSDDQRAIDCSVTQGESRHQDLVDIIHQEDLALPGGRPRGQPVEVTYSYDESQIMHCVFRDVGTGAVYSVDLSPEKDGEVDDLSDLLID